MQFVMILIVTSETAEASNMKMALSIAIFYCFAAVKGKLLLSLLSRNVQ